MIPMLFKAIIRLQEVIKGRVTLFYENLVTSQLYSNENGRPLQLLKYINIKVITLRMILLSLTKYIYIKFSNN